MKLETEVRELLAPGGRIAQRWPRYEDREAQRLMACDVARVVEQGGVLLAEAPTGVGKSLAYLLPSVLAVRDTDRRVVIATCTKSLQDQLFERDLPALLEALGISITCARLKGKQNYLCPKSLEMADSESAEERDVLESLRRWAGVEEIGDLDRFPADDPEAYRRIRARVATDPVACSGPACRRGRECFWVRARRRAGESKLLIVNHALLALSGEAEGLLPEFDVLIVDEAHRLEGVLLQQLERSVSRHRFDEALRVLGARRGAARRPTNWEGGAAGGLLARAAGYLLPLFDAERRDGLRDDVDRLARRVTPAREQAEAFFASVEPRGARHEIYGARERYRSVRELLGSELQPLEALLGECTAFSRGLSRLAATMGSLAPKRESGPASLEEEMQAELDHGAMLWSALASDLEHLAEASDKDWVYWRTGAAHPSSSAAGGRGVELHGAPIGVGAHARRLVIGRARAAVLTSATLAAGGDFAFSAERLGLGEDRGLPYEVATYPTPFPLERQMRAFVLTERAQDEAGQIADVVAALAESGRNQLVLFTAHERLRRVRERLRSRLSADRVLLAQEWDGPAGRVSERFRAHRGAVLLGVQSLWEGVDFPGEALEILVVAKLPFSVPDDPLVEARGERLEERGLDPFRDDAVPEAVLRFRQGVGRLIRRADDRGVLVVCDPRFATASYRRAFREALAVEPELMRDAGTLAHEAEMFFNAAPAVDDATVDPVVVDVEDPA